jgi:hypothetical protein
LEHVVDTDKNFSPKRVIFFEQNLQTLIHQKSLSKDTTRRL